MARFTEPSADQQTSWNAWVAERPDKVRAVAERFDPWTLYLLKTSNHRVEIRSFGEELSGGDTTLVVAVLGKWNLVTIERQVFGIRPEDLEECDLPGPGELVGARFTKPEEIAAHIERMRKRHQARDN